MSRKGQWPVKPYTRSGDSGETGLFFGKRVRKDEVGPEAYGACDESCAALGLARAANTDPGLELVLKKLQRELFVVGAELATAPENRDKLQPGETKVTAEMVESLEQLIDTLLEFVDPPRAFVLPGSNFVAGQLDYARTVIRRAERAVVAAKAAGWVSNEHLLAYMNRLGDLVYTLARWQEGSKYEKL